MNKHSLFYALVLVTATLFSGCKADVDLSNVDTTSEVGLGLALPVGSMTATIGDFLGNGQVDGIYVGKGNVLFFRDTFDITRTFHDVNLKEKVSNVDKKFHVYDQLKDNGDLNPDGTVKTGKPVTLKFPFAMKLKNINNDEDEERIDSVLIDKSKFYSTIGKFEWDEFKEEYIDRVDIVLGQEFEREEGKIIRVCKKGDFKFDKEIPIDINEFMMKLMKNEDVTRWSEYFNKNVKDSCHLEIHFHFTIPNGNKVHVKSTTRYNYHLRVEFIQFIAVWGFFRPSSDMRDADTVIIENEWKKWRDLKKATLPFDTPKVYLNIKSKIAGAMIMHGEYLYAKSLQKNDSVFATFDRANKQLTRVVRYNNEDGNYFMPLKSAIGDSIWYKPILFDEQPERGHIDRLFALRPDILGYKFFIDFDSVISPQVRLLPNTNIIVNADVNAAFQFNKGLEASYIDTIKDVNLNKITLDSLLASVEQVDTIMTSDLYLVLAIENKIPLRMKGVFRFRDENDQVVMDPNNKKKPFGVSESDTLLIDAPKVVYAQGSSYIGEPGKTVYAISVNKKHFDTLEKIKNVEFYVELDAEQMNSAYDKDPTYRVKLTTEDKLKVQIGLSAKIEAILNFNSKEEKK